MKKIIALVLVLTLALCFAACGKEDDSSAAVDLEAKYGISFTAEGEQTLSADRASKDKLIETKDTWLGGKMTFALDPEQKTYEDFVEYIGCDASTYSYSADDAERSFVWIAEGDETAKFIAVFWETPNGWTLYSVGSTNLSK